MIGKKDDRLAARRNLDRARTTPALVGSTWSPSTSARIARSLPRTEEVLKFPSISWWTRPCPRTTRRSVRVPREERGGLVTGESAKSLVPERSNERYNWVLVRLSAIDVVEVREPVVEAWRIAVPKQVAAAHLGERPPT